MRNQEFMTLGNTLVILGIVFGQDRLIGYSFIDAGVLLSIASASILRRTLHKQSDKAGGA